MYVNRFHHNFKLVISQQVSQNGLKSKVISPFFLNFKWRCDQLKPFLYENIYCFEI